MQCTWPHPVSADEQKPMATVNEAEADVADCRCHAAPQRSEVLLPAEHTDAPQYAAGTLSVRLLTAHEQHQNVAVISVQGDIDLATAPVLREGLLSVLEHQTGPVVADLSEVPFMDASGVRVLLDALQRLNPQNRRFAIACRDGGQVHRILDLLGLLDSLAVYRSRETAVLGGDDVLRSEPGRNGRPADVRPPSIRPVNDQAPQAS
jgi:anti-sigma B factor antagonist